jgi:N-acetylglutamate synthase-like GNAT family acetyltransferase
MKNPEQKSENLGDNEPMTEKEKFLCKISTYTNEYKEKVTKFFEEMEKEFPEITGAYDVRDIPKYFQGDEKNNFWLALGDNNEIAGTAGLRNYGNEIGYLSRLYIKKDLRGKGIGSELMAERIKFAKENGYKKIFGATMPKNVKAHEFDIKQGFKMVDSPPPTVSWTFSEGTKFIEMDLENENK